MSWQDNEVASFLLEFGVLLAALAVLSRLAARLGLPTVPLYLLGGLAFGGGGLLPLGFSESFIAAGADIGVLLLLFALGLEFSGDDLRGALRQSRAASLLDLLNALPGLAAALVLGLSWQAALLLGAATYVSSSGIVAKILEDLDRIGNRETPVVLGILVAEDLMMAAVLPVLAVAASGQPIISALATALGAGLVAFAAVIVAMRHGHRISRLLVHASDETLLLSVLALVLLVGAAAEQLHVSAAVGAFLVGTALSDPVADRAQHLIRPLRDLFAATFFLFFALGIAPSSLLAMLWMAVALWGVGVVGKVLTGWWAARQAGIGPRGAMRAGTALIARGEFSILIAQLAASTHAGADLPALVGGYVLLCAISGPVLARWADRLADRLPGRAVVPS